MSRLPIDLPPTFDDPAENRPRKSPAFRRLVSAVIMLGVLAYALGIFLDVMVGATA